MRLWSLHPKYLDGPGLVALWREALLAQAVLRGRTRGYRHHPQLARFRDVASPCGGIAQYLRVVHAESRIRGYAFAPGKISRARCLDLIPVRRGQLDYEWEHLMRKLKARDPARAKTLQSIRRPQTHPLFRIVRGPLEEWERPGRGQVATNSLGAGGQFDKVACAMPDTAKQQLLRKGADLLGRVELAALLDVHASLLEAWISGHASMPDRQLLVLTHILDKVARK